MKKEIIIILSVLVLAMIVTGSGAIYQSTVEAGGGTLLSKVSTTEAPPTEPPTETVWVDTTETTAESDTVTQTTGDDASDSGTLNPEQTDTTPSSDEPPAETVPEETSEQQTVPEATESWVTDTEAPFVPDTSVFVTEPFVTEPFVSEPFVSEPYESDTGFSESSDTETPDDTLTADTEPSETASADTGASDTEPSETTSADEETAVAETEGGGDGEAGGGETDMPDSSLYLTQQTLRADLKYLFDMFCYHLDTYPQSEMPNMNYSFDRGMTLYKQKFGNYAVLKRFAQEYYALIDTPLFTDTADNIYDFKIFIDKNNQIGSSFDYSDGKDYTATAVYIKCADAESGKLLNAFYTSDGIYFDGTYDELLGVTSVTGDLYDRLLNLFG